MSYITLHQLPVKSKKIRDELIEEIGKISGLDAMTLINTVMIDLMRVVIKADKNHKYIITEMLYEHAIQSINSESK